MHLVASSSLTLVYLSYSPSEHRTRHVNLTHVSSAYLQSLTGVVPNLWYAYLLGVCENNIANGGKHQKRS
jgi:hypothetical protein